MKYWTCFLLSLSFSISLAQDVHVTAIQDLDFGKFYVTGNGYGNIIVRNDGTWYAENNVRHIGLFPRAAIFNIWTESLKPIKVKVEIFNSQLTNTANLTGHRVDNDENIQYHIVSHDSPLRISVGGILRLESSSGKSWGTYQGNVSVRATILPFLTD
ncbi:DUF4402 domain-containing protein [Arenibacter sp. BSSL-BM3]|uniref:DUF4402 domain-containing protein n=1 Tax=Arenibacter arenosicollis TaxID=2762274 RepID=A0ABR7QQB2_9FLAO|nr:DUF4402 domain-containing protein [Arenibacter arenosicollis]MBC8769378.1 DUF4402 domain-containing protein [Arenibacter arenosicollis]